MLCWAQPGPYWLTTTEAAWVPSLAARCQSHPWLIANRKAPANMSPAPLVSIALTAGADTSKYPSPS